METDLSLVLSLIWQLDQYFLYKNLLPRMLASLGTLGIKLLRNLSSVMSSDFGNIIRKLESQDSITNSFHSATMWIALFPSQHKNLFKVCESAIHSFLVWFGFSSLLIWGHKVQNSFIYNIIITLK